MPERWIRIEEARVFDIIDFDPGMLAPLTNWEVFQEKPLEWSFRYHDPSGEEKDILTAFEVSTSIINSRVRLSQVSRSGILTASIEDIKRFFVGKAKVGNGAGIDVVRFEGVNKQILEITNNGRHRGFNAQYFYTPIGKS